MKIKGWLSISFSVMTLACILALPVLPAPSQAATAKDVMWTKGHRKVLVIPVSFTDADGPSNSDARGFTGWTDLTNGVMPAAISNFFLSQSYGKFSVDFTILPVIPLGVPSTYYTNNCPGTPSSKWTVWGAPGSLADDARAMARAIGLTNGLAAQYESANYDFDVIATGYLPGQVGAASDGGRTVIAFNYFTALPHELCHCLGLAHANGRSSPTYTSPLNAASVFFQPYGDVYCLMGWKENSRTATPPPDRDANAYFKYELGWLTASNICTPTISGTYRVYAFDQGSVTPGSNYAIRIARDSSYTYWLDFRQAITNLPDSKWSQNGLEVHYGAESPRSSSGATVLWDMTPGSRGPTGTTFATMHDAPLPIGRTYTDAEAHLHVTPISKGGTSPESLDVVVNLGDFPGNQSPTLSISPSTVSLTAGTPQTFTATASDPDGDTLSYFWEFDDNQASGGTDFGGVDGDSRFATNGVHSWSQKGDNFVRCTVSDMKGHTRTVSALVTVTTGSGAPITISGMVRDELGNPLAGAVVNTYRGGGAYGYGGANFAGSSETAADGKYQIAVPYAYRTYPLSVICGGYTFTNASGTNISSVAVVTNSVANIDFTRVRAKRTISGGVYVSGHGYTSATYGNLWISDGTQSVLVTNGSWALSVDDGTLVTLTATADNPAYTISSDFPKPYLVTDTALTLTFFVDIPGEMPLTGFDSSGASSDDTVGTVAVPVTMTLPPGTTNWGNDQVFFCKIDESSTAEYGVDYKMGSAMITFYGSLAPSPYVIPLTILRNDVPKHKTIVIKLIPGSSIANLGPIHTYTYTIVNPVPPVTASIASGSNMMELTWASTTAVHYTVESSPTLVPAMWEDLAPHTNLPGLAGSMTRHVDISGMTQGVFRIKAE